MLYRGNSFVPDGCPSIWLGNGTSIEDMEFELHAGYGEDESGKPVVWSQAWFIDDTSGELSSQRHIRSYVEMPADSPHASQAQLAKSDIANADSQVRRDRVRELLCDRVANCRGVIEGTCWALGGTALTDVYTQVGEEFGVA